ncbi:bifunctional folylpolyglutamate synthase/dihydrofolate synthase [Halanaerobium hydrogeniformans]|uniref:tetrahydrofolate synthase n=1 Tax=Halanaerobium hydrogeniformans TaxID=656519 RepID=E4RML4_HALHG|nr:folylpolyglutamate synthase/dihydrofolate synthase family protein [Halanaerobium hydrogeniformans]ADQ14545.1 FolC bifunctional protein [Halanaerobium hydrogeniformans]
MDPYSYINSLSLFGTKGGYNPGLKRIKKLLAYLGNPEQNFNVIHLAGTNGKGSTAAFIENIYRQAGYKTALYTSPHFYHFNERIKVNGKAASTYLLKDLIKELKKAVEKLKKDGFGEASFFEVVTALAFLYFEFHQPDIVILETGLGGRLDATNVIKKPLLSIITTIDIEHSKLLGNSQSEIAYEKAGIIKENSKVLTAVTSQEALSVIEKTAAEKSTQLIKLTQKYDKIKSSGGLKKNYLYFSSSNKKYKYKLSLLGMYQAQNAALAHLAVNILKSEFPFKKEDLQKGLSTVVWPGRMQKISKKPLTILDGAHNPAAVKALAESLKTAAAEFNNIHLIFSALNDKDIVNMLSCFLNFKPKIQLYLAENNSFRTSTLAELEKTAKSLNFKYQLFSSLSQAAEEVVKVSKKDDLILAAGSFSTVFESGITLMTKKF